MWSSGFIRAAQIIIGVNYRVLGRENIPDEPCIFVCNHQSYWESIALTAFIPDINVISKTGAMAIPVFGWGLRHAPMIPVNRTQRGMNLRRIVREAERSIANGRSVLIFPEGTRVKPGARRRYLRGLKLLYASCNAPMVPIVQDAGRCWTEGFSVKHPGMVTMRFDPAIEPGHNPAEVAQNIEAHINREKDGLLLSGPQDSTSGAQAVEPELA